MSTVQEIEEAITRLRPSQVKQVAAWLSDYSRCNAPSFRVEQLRKARGIWKGRTDFPKVRALRHQFDRV